MLGRGANVLVADEGFPGAVIRLVGPEWERVDWPLQDQAPQTGDAGATRDAPMRVNAPMFGDAPMRGEAAQRVRVTAAAGADFVALVKEAVRRGLAGLENLAGIPGAVGGIIRMNAGGKYGCVADYVDSVRVLSATGEIADWPRDAVGFRYRHTELDACVVLAATLRLTPDDPAAIQQRYLRIWREKYDSQPPLSERSAGCVFKNPPKTAAETRSAGALIDQAGLKGTSIGGAVISSKHANFIVAGEGATSADILALIALAQARVRERFGIELQTEVEIWR